MRLGLAFCSTIAILGVGCSSNSGIAPYGYGSPPSPPGEAIPPPAGDVATDTRPPVVAATPPPPISGGTLLVTHDGNFAVAADPDRDRISVASVLQKSLLWTIALNAGDEPGRVVEDSDGHVHVALRRGGAVVTIDPVSGALLRRTAVCGAPRGIAFEASTKLLHIACAEGDLVSLPADGGDPVRHLHLDPDLRDVVVLPDGLMVSRFKSASFLKIDGQGNIVQTLTTQRIGRTIQKMAASNSFPQPVAEGMDPAVAWRTIGSPSGQVLMLHQYGLAEPIDIGQKSIDIGQKEMSPVEPVAPQPYGAPAGTTCGGGLVSPAVTTMNGAGQVQMGTQIGHGVLTVDLSVSPDGAWIALAHAGTPDPAAPNGPSIIPVTPSALATPMGEISIMKVGSTAVQDPTTENCVSPDFTIGTQGQATAIAFNPNMDPQTTGAQGVWFVVQTREPAELVFVRDPMNTQSTTLDLGGASVLDSGHELFHRDSGAGIACAECHAEGGEDGRVWKFNPTGDRRTQALHVGIAGTEPFHWDGDMTDLGVLMDEVFVRRMGGAHQTPERLDALKNWLNSLRPPAPIGDPSSAAAIAGKALFESDQVGCITCHAGVKHTNSQNAYVGTTETGHTLQVPSLVGIGYRAPFLHNGCAATLRDRFDPACGGGDKHGLTSALSEEQVGNLIAYLQTL